jgi:hypothetical protein
VLPWACLVLLAAAPARAAENVLKLVPDSALGFLLVNRPAEVDGKLQELGRQMQLPVPSLLAKIKQAGGIAEGFDEKGTAALLLLPPEDTRLGVPIILVPVTDYGKFIAQFNPGEAEAGLTKIEVRGAPVWARSIGGYAALTCGGVSKTVTGLMGLKLAGEVPAGLAPLEAWLTENDFAAVITRPGIKIVSAKAQEGISRMKATFAKLGETGKTKQMAGRMKQAVAGLEVYVKLLQALEREVSLCGLGAQLDKQGVLRVTSRTRMVAGGKWAQLVAPIQPAKEDPLTGLPAGPYVMAGGGVVPPGTWEAVMRFSVDMMKAMPDLYGLSDEQADKLQHSIKLSMLKQIRSTSMVWGVGQSGAPMFAGMVGVMRVDDTAKFMADYEQYFKEYNEVVKQAKSPFLQPGEVEKIAIGGVPALQITIKIPSPPGSQPAQIARVMEFMFGPGGKVVLWLAAADGHTVVFGYNKRAVQEAMDAIKQGRPGLWQDADLAKTAALLPPGAPLVGYLSPKGTIEFVKRIAMAVPPGAKTPEYPKHLAFLVDFPATPPIGLAITTAPGELQTHMVVPPEVFKAAAGVYLRTVKGEGGAFPQK